MDGYVSANQTGHAYSKALKENKVKILENYNVSEIDYHNLISYHNKKKADITICGKNKVFEMPYGEIIQNQEI